METTSTPYRRRFRAREYPALNFLVMLNRGFAALVVVSWLITLVGLSVGGLGTLAGGAEVASTGIVLVFAFVLSTISHGVVFAIFLASAESIKILIDIQSNTQHTADLLKRP